jgi:hypothetical protein
MENKSALREAVALELNLIKASETIGGAITHVASLLNKIRTIPRLNRILANAEADLAEEDRVAFENLEKAVAWLHEKIRTLLPYTKWEEGSYQAKHVNNLLNFATVTLSANGYVGSLLLELNHISSVVVQDKENYHLFEGWAQFQDRTKDTFHWPEYVDKALNAHLDQHEWQKNADRSLTCLLRFLKILILMDSFVPLTLGFNPTQHAVPKSLRELEAIDYQAYVGMYLSSFRSSDPSKHPLSLEELRKKVDVFLDLFEQRIDSCLGDEQSSKNTKSGHWRTCQRNQDVNILIPFAKNLWEKEIRECQHPEQLGRTHLAKKLLDRLPPHISLHSKGDKRLPRAKRALKFTDPRIFNNGKCVGLRPHWDQFSWVLA